MTPERRSPGLPLRTLALGAFVINVLWVLGLALFITTRVRPGATALESDVQVVADEFERLSAQSRSLEAEIRWAEDHAVTEPEGTARRLRTFQGALSKRGAMSAASALARVPAELRMAMGRAAEAESVAEVVIREASAHLELGAPDRALERLQAAHDHSDALSAALLEAQGLGLQDLLRREAALAADAGAVTRAILWWLAVGLILFPAGLWVLQRRLYRPLTNLERGLERVSRGDLDTRLEVERGDEIGLLSRHFNRMTEVLRARAREARAEREQVQQELERSELYFRSFVEQASDIIWVVDGDGLVTFASPATRGALGYEPEALSGRPAHELIHTDDVDRWRAVLQGRDIDSASPRVVRFRHENGGWRSVEIAVRDLRDDPAVNGVVVASRDITELLEREEQLRQAQKMEAVGQLTGGVAHDFNNLLTVIQGNLDLLAERLGDGEGGELARDAMVAAGRGAMLTQRLLAFSRRQALRPEVVEPGALVENMFDLLRRTLGETIELRAVRPAHLWPCEVDPGQLENAVLNLALNARDAMPEGGVLTLEFGNRTFQGGDTLGDEPVRPGTYALIAVRDSGVGMDAAVLDRVFEPFFTTKEVGKGSGLGLSMVYGFVKQSSGYISLTSEVRKGTSVEIFLPRAGAPVLDRDAAPRMDGQLAGSGETILVVEDDVFVRQVAVTLLVRLGYVPLEAPDAASALRILSSPQPVDLLFSDVVLPGGKSGLEMAEEMQALRPDLPVLFTSGYTGDEFGRHGRLEPGWELLEKPYSRADLARMIRRALEGGKA